jgi:ERCC4-type nuclease
VDATVGIVIDTREQRPLDFSHLPGVTVSQGSLLSGDYSIPGLEEHFAVERKSLDDLAGSLTSDRDRFRRELHRLRGFSFARLLVEGDISVIEAHRYRSKASPRSILASLSAFEVEFNVPVVFIRDRQAAATWLARSAWYFLRARSKGIITPGKEPCPFRAVEASTAGVEALGV